MGDFWQGFLWGIGILAAVESAGVFVFFKIMSNASITG